MGEPLTGRTSDQYNIPRMKRFYYDVVSYENDKYMCNLKRSSHLFMGSYFALEGFE